jgi:2-amino-4-hydroxy-6-hydroxymethyldihydropteridine diphosphokinase
MTEAWLAQAYLAFGGNVGDSRTILDRAVTQLCDGTEVRLIKRSADYRTPPWGFKYQPPFINLCIAVETILSPRALLARAQEVELQLGRDRSHEKRWGPRTADIDIIAYDSLTIDELGLTVPHPRLFERAFVLVPLVEIAPDLTIAGKTVRQALTEVDPAGIQRLPPLA